MITGSVLTSVESDLLHKGEVLAFYLRTYTRENPDAGRRLVDAIVEQLEKATSSDDNEVPMGAAPQPTARLRPSRLVLVAAQPNPRDDIEAFILENLATSNVGLSVKDLVDRFDEALIKIRRQTLVVRLHRMVQAGKLAVRSHGHYALSDAVGMRTQNG